MQASLTERAVGCIGKCTSGLSREELDQITDNINKTLVHPRGRKIFKKYLEQRDLTDNLECLALYEACCVYIDIEKNDSQSKKETSLECLINSVTIVKEMAEDLDISEIDKKLLESFNEALESESRTELIGILEETRDCCRDHLRNIHKDFKKYASEPCPLKK